MAQQQTSMTSIFGNLSWKERAASMAWLVSFPALTVMVFMRRRIGFRQLMPIHLVGMAFLLVMLAQYAPEQTGGLFGWMAEPPEEIPFGFNAPVPRDWGAWSAEDRQDWQKKHAIPPEKQQEVAEKRAAELKSYEGRARFARKAQEVLTRWPLNIFAGVMLVLGIVQRRQRWVELCNEIPWHTRSRGISFFDHLNLPLRTNQIHRFIDPLACFTIGWIISLVSKPLGYWLIFSAFCWYMIEQYVYDQQLEQYLDAIDGLVNAEVHSKNMAGFQRGQNAAAAVIEQQSLPLEQTAGIPTGIAPELQAQIARRKRRLPPDDLDETSLANAASV